MTVVELKEILGKLPEYMNEREVVVETLDDFFDIDRIEDGEELRLFINVQVYEDETVLPAVEQQLLDELIEKEEVESK